MRLANKVVVVTGGANGIGRALCRRFAAEGAKAVVVADVQASMAERVADAGGGVRGGVNAPDVDWERSWQVNVMAHVYSARAVLPGMFARGEGYLLQTV